MLDQIRSLKADSLLTDWKPTQDTHAISQASLSILFKDDLGDVALRRLQHSVLAIAGELGLVDVSNLDSVLPPELLALGLNPGPSRGVAVVRRNEDGSVAERFEVTRDGATFYDYAYIRWAPFRDRALALLQPAYRTLAENTTLVHAANEYTDVFLGKDGVERPDVREVVDQHSPLIAAAAFRATDDWHCNSGWYEDREPPLKRVVNVNIDVATRGDPGVRTLRMLTRCVERPLEPEAEAPDWSVIASSFEASHQTLKKTLALALTPAATQAISLNP
ncbi:hypothetical protein [Brevundimonas sp.]|uniref:hypothetical protein n=1 Tax=Brevundimonas sp. TaxID=1871086 RepID=UPI00286C026B|nr:hypothetical protein [Brevundimonas sp.]